VVRSEERVDVLPAEADASGQDHQASETNRAGGYRGCFADGRLSLEGSHLTGTEMPYC
jgi:hypothetical protein